MSKIDCHFCGESFKRDETKRNWKHVKFCSDECRKGFAAQKKREHYRPKPVEDKECSFCKKTFTPSLSSGARQKYCSRECLLAKRKVDAHELWSDERRTKVCANCGEDFLPVKFSGGRQIYCSKGCQVSAIAKRHDYKYRRGGASQYEFSVVRPFILERDKVCVFCGSGDKLHVHHWDNSGRGDDCDNSPENLAVLCGDCHSAIHKVTLARVNGEWCLDGRIFEIAGLTGSIPIK